MDVPYEVVDFLCIQQKTALITYKSKNNRLTTPMKQAIEKIPKGGNLTFTAVDVKGPSGKVKRLESGIVIKLI